MTYPAVIFWILFPLGAVASQRTLLILLFASFTFGSFAVLPPELTGDRSFTPKTMFAMLLVVRFIVPTLLVAPQRLVELARLKNLGFLLAFLAIGVVTTIFMPSLFDGVIDVIPLRGVLRFASAEPLTPTGTNITQCIYLSISVMVVFAAALMARTPQFASQLLSAVLVGGVVLFGSGIADMAATALGQSAVLEPFRNASYAIGVNVEIAGVRRVIGLMNEPSTFGSTCVALCAALVFLRPLYPAGLPRTAATATAVSLVIMALLSTSSSAYVGLAIFGAVNVLNVARRMTIASPIARSGLVPELVAVFISVIVILAALIVQPELFDPFFRMVDEIIFNKANSDSYLERTFWNQVGWNAFWSTYGLGVGVGSTRASNYFVAVLSNTGFLASSCFFIFLIQTFLRRSFVSVQSSEFVTALKFAIVPSLGLAALGSATPDFDAWLGLVFGAIAGLSLQNRNAAQAAHFSSVEPYSPEIDLRGVH
jgi:hypothetical protein